MTDGNTPSAAVRLVPIAAAQIGPVLAGDLAGLPRSPTGEMLRAGRGWPHDDTPHALAFTEVGGLTWLVVDETGAIIGELGTKGPATAAGVVEIGYGLAAPSRGQGLGSAAVRALVALLEGRPEITTLAADVALDNLASQRLLERLGFACVGSDERELHYELHAGGGRDLG